MRPVKLALCGYGLVGQRHVTAARQVDGVALDHVVEPAAAGRAAAERAGLACYHDLDSLMAATRVDGLVIATPTSLHREQTLAALQQGCPVLVEKPITTTSDEASAIVSAVKASGVPVLVGHHRRHNPLIQKARQMIDEGLVGDVRAVQATCWFYKPDHYFDTAPWRKERGAGPVSVNLVHDVDLIRHLCGEVESVSARAAPSRRGFANEDVAAAVLTLTNGAIVTISVSDSTVAPWSWEMTSGEYPIYPRTDQSCYLIGGSRGALSLPDLKLWRHDGEQPDWWTPISAVAGGYVHSDPLVNQIRHFRDVIHGAVDPLVSAEEGLRSLRTVEAIQVSAARNGLPIPITSADATAQRAS
ncbi:Gfo/Idh/MocA family oxidoreductase [Rhodobacterales bacterium HKCCSP123]|nr:Gfo/Idh/MocA family oxidoreductase [Rhodobacterales bacterium HKCCSP123]